MISHTSLIVVVIAAGILHLFSYFLGPLAEYGTTKQQPPAPDQAPSRICEAHFASVAVATVSGAHDLTFMIHEVLDLDMTAYPFENLDALVNGDLRRIQDLEKVVLNAYMRETHRMYSSGATRGTVPDRVDMRARRERALRLSAIVFSDMVSRIEYLRKVWPATEEAARACKSKQGKGCRQSRKVAHIDQWCRDHGFQVDGAA